MRDIRRVDPGAYENPRLDDAAEGRRAFQAGVSDLKADTMVVNLMLRRSDKRGRG